MHKKKSKAAGYFSAAVPSLGAIVMGIIFGFLVMLISNPSQALIGLKMILLGGFSDGAKSVGQILYYAAPLLLMGLSVGFAFKTGLFNIGASGQLICGAFGAVYVGVKWTFLPGSIHWLAALLAAMLCGALCACIPGILKAFFNVNEVVSSIMMNYISVFAVNLLVSRTIYDNVQNQSLSVASGAEIPTLGLERLFPGSGVDIGIIIALLCAVIMSVILNKTAFGFEMKACGFNRDASLYAGVNTTRNIILSMVIAGTLAGLGGGILYLAGTGKHIIVLDSIPSEGFMGISIALLGLSSPIGIVLAALFISYITIGGFYLQLYNYPVQMVDMIISAIIYFSAFAIAIRRLTMFIRRHKRKGEKA